MNTSLQSLDLILKLESALAGEGNMVTLSLRQAIKEGKPANLILRTVKDMIRDNEVAMGYIIGQTLVTRIKSFEI